MRWESFISNPRRPIFYRVQPAGLPLSGHSSATSADEQLPDGYLFAYASPTHLMAGEGESWSIRDSEPQEVVEFYGSDAYAPGDVEGVAVRPQREVRRMPIVTWLRNYAHSRNEDVRQYAREILETYSSHSRFLSELARA